MHVFAFRIIFAAVLKKEFFNLNLFPLLGHGLDFVTFQFVELPSNDLSSANTCILTDHITVAEGKFKKSIANAAKILIEREECSDYDHAAGGIRMIRI